MHDQLLHTGVGHEDDPPGRGSGRYGWGTGKNPGQHQFDFLSEVQTLKKRGLKDAEIAKMLLGQKGTMKDGTPIWCNSTDLRAEMAIETKRVRQAKMQRALELYDKYNGNASAVGREMGINESSVRSLLNPIIADRTTKYENTANMLREKVEEKGMIDVSKATEYSLGCTASTKNVAIAMLEKEGYVRVKVNIPQPGRKDQNTVTNVLAKPLPGETPKETFVRVQQNKFDVQPIDDYTPDQGITWWKPEFPTSVDSKRVMIRYKEDGGEEKDGVIEINPMAKDLSLEGSQYAQVRIAVDGTNYMKGMAIYGLKKDFPKGIDVIYNTNKKVGTPAIDNDAVYDPENDTWSGKEVLKRMKIDRTTMEVDRNNPFGATIKAPKEKDGVLITRGGQHYYTDSDGTEKLSPINKVREEGEWDTWSKNLSSQFLSKQPYKLIKQQIDLSVAQRKTELEEIQRLTNPVIRKKLLEDFAGNCDANAVDLSVKGVKNQAFQVILPIPSMKDNEIYAPKFDDGDTVALIRYPHAGIFEIPVLKVNNKNEDAKKIMKNASDAVGINSTVASQLSGADFDGDTVVVLPLTSNRLSVKSTPYLEDLKNFDPKMYKLPDSAPPVLNRTKQIQMGITTNLIADMTAQGATEPEMVRAVKHSMVVIDSEKHHLDWKLSERENDIQKLKDKYQKSVNPVTGEETHGASTIYSRAKNPTYINKVKEITDTSKMTPDELNRWNEGKRVYRETGDYKKKPITDPSKMTPSELEVYNAGKKVYRESDEHVQMKVKRMEIVDDAMTLVRNPGDPKEVAYANYANALKGMANEARKEARNIKPYKVDTEARKTYAAEVKSLDEKLRVAQSNNPKERRATMIANSLISERMKSNPDMDHEHKQRVEAQCMTEARAMVGAKKIPVVITDEEWNAIQAHAISSTKLREILLNTDQEAFKKRATPRQDTRSATDTQIQRIKSMANSGMYTQKDIADALGLSTSTVSTILRNAN